MDAGAGNRARLKLTPELVREALEASRGLVSSVTERMQRRSPAGEPHPRRTHPPDGVVARQGAVVALLYPGENGLTVPLTERTAHLGSHAGQISFPGGRVEVRDASPWHAAARETLEEIGVDLTGVEPWAQLRQIYVQPSNFLVSGFVAYLDRRPRFKLNTDEVARLIEIPLDVLLQDESFSVYERNYEGKMVLEGHFTCLGYRIWGATAILLDQLLERIQFGIGLLEEAR